MVHARTGRGDGLARGRPLHAGSSHVSGERTGSAQQAEAVRARMLIPLTLVLAVLLVGFVGAAYWTKRGQMEEDIARRVRAAEELFNEELGDRAAVLGAAVSYSFAGIFGKRLKSTPAVVNATGMLICSSIMMLPFAIFIDSPWALKPSLEAMAAVCAMAIISTAMAYLLYFGILASAGATNVLLVTFLIPISALLLGMGVLGEVIRLLEYTGMGCIFLGLMLIDGRVLNWIRKRLNFATQIGYHLNIQKGK